VALPSLLYVSPVLPATTGNGLAMRAGMVLRALAQRYRVSLLVASIYSSPGSASFDELGVLCHQVAVLPPDSAPPRPSPAKPRRLSRWLGLGRLASPDRTNGIAEPAFRDAPFDVVHVFRLSSLPFARPWLAPRGRRPARHLDLDDLESATHRRLAALYRSNGDQSRADAEERKAERAAALEAEVLRGFDRVYVCSEADRARLGHSARARVYALPNALPLPEPLPPKAGDGPFTFLFVGTLGYYPNEDAVRYFCREVLPRLRHLTPRPLRLNIVGTRPSRAVRSLGLLPDIQVVGPVADPAPWYQSADAVVVPIRAGGGTRIKVLEAFSYRRPVVSTSIGIEGIDALADQHLLVGDSPEALAAACARLMSDPALGDALTEAAYALVAKRYTFEAVSQRLARLG
jgi:glycosyltransferase involved in cell wall biosynthesis